MREAFLVVLQQLTDSASKLEIMNKIIQRNSLNLQKKEKRHADSIEEVMNFVRDKIYKQSMKADSTMNTLQQVIESNHKLLNADFESMNIDFDRKVSGP